MAKKLTEQEQAAVVALAKLLGKELPADQRGNAGGIASGLVRLRQNPIPEKDIRTVVARYDGDDRTIGALIDLGVLAVMPDNGGYELVLPGTPDGDAEGAPTPDADAGSDAPIERASRRAPSRRESRSLSHLDCVRKQTPELNEVRRQIVSLDPRLWINGWLLSSPDAFVLYERELRALDAALAGKPALGDGTLSVRELSYQVFGDEKFLALESDGRKLLHLMGLSDIVSSRPQVRLDLMHHIPKRHRHMRLVVSENLDPWVNMRNALYRDGRKRLLGERVHGVVFGNGYIVDDPHKLPDLIATLDAESVCVLYWGDIDRAGISILDKLHEMADGRFEVRPFTAAYRLMLRRAMDRFPDPLDNEGTDQRTVPAHGLELLEADLSADEAAYLRAVVDNARLIPQEIVTAADL